MKKLTKCVTGTIAYQVPSYLNLRLIDRKEMFYTLQSRQEAFDEAGYSQKLDSIVQHSLLMTTYGNWREI